jgi:hypothetical protein
MVYYSPFPKGIHHLKVGCVRVTHPSATRHLEQALMLPSDLHVLSLPLAFILSQDQTLHSLFPELLKKSSYLFKTCVFLILFLPVVSMIVFPSYLSS